MPTHGERAKHCRRILMHCGVPGREMRVKDVSVRAPLPVLRPVDDRHDQQHGEDFDPYADYDGERRPGLKAEHADRGGDGQLEEMPRADQARWAGATTSNTQAANAANRGGFRRESGEKDRASQGAIL
jgi:hypothetical protein